jgi:hypothetical protein
MNRRADAEYGRPVKPMMAAPLKDATSLRLADFNLSANVDSTGSLEYVEPKIAPSVQQSEL